MKLSNLEKEIIAYRLTVPDAMADVLEDTLEYNVSWDECERMIRERTNTLINKLENASPLDEIEEHMLNDIASDYCYVDSAIDNIGYVFDEKKMTRQRAKRIESVHNQLVEKLTSAFTWR
jgi:hypothetical protein